MYTETVILFDKYLIFLYVLFITYIIYRFYRARLLDYLLALAITGMLTELIKYIVNKPRPVEPLTGMVFEGSSFPSTHTAVAFASFFFVLISCRYLSSFGIKKKSREGKTVKILVFLMILIGASTVGVLRVLVGAHYIIDIFAGIIIGLFVSIPFRYYDVVSRRLR